MTTKSSMLVWCKDLWSNDTLQNEPLRITTFVQIERAVGSCATLDPRDWVRIGLRAL